MCPIYVTDAVGPNCHQDSGPYIGQGLGILADLIEPRNNGYGYQVKEGRIDSNLAIAGQLGSSETFCSLVGGASLAGDPQELAQRAMITATCGLGLLEISSAAIHSVSRIASAS